jgi:ribosomal-protein-alanine N-acetyltransferase
MTKTIPTLSTKRLTLRPFQISDASDVARYVGNKVIAANTLSIPHPYTIDMAEEWIGTHASAFEQGEGVNFAITNKETGELLGAIGLVIEPDHDRAEMGYWIGQPFWNRGFASEAAAEIIHYGFESLNLERIHAQHFTTNPASGKVMLNTGMSREGLLRHHIKKWDQYQDVEVYSILRAEWQEQKGSN